MKRRFTVLILICLVFQINAYAQPGVPNMYEGDVYLTSQAEVDSFNCTEITGSLGISGPDITDLSALQNLSKVGFLFITETTNLTNVNGLSGLREITQKSGFPYSIGITGNASLKNLDGLAHLTANSVGAINISNNPMLESINGFASVDTVKGLFSISNNAVLTSLNGFRNVTVLRDGSLPPYLLIDNNPSLANLDGFSALKRIEGTGANFQVSNNPALSSLNGLSAFEYISGGGRGTGLFIINNDSLLNIDGLSGFKGLGYGPGGAIMITDNALLEDVSGIANTKVSPGAFRFTLTNNPSLADCNGLYPFLENYGLSFVNSTSFIISDNGSSCTLEEILASGPPAITGFSIYNTAIGVVERDFYLNGEVIDIAFSHSDQVLQANTRGGEKIGSVAFTVNNALAYVDNEAPYRYDFSSLPVGTFTILTEVYSQPNGQGTKGLSATLSFRRYNSTAVQSFDIVDTQGNIIEELREGARINIRHPSYRNINIRANTNPYAVNNVKFYLNNRLHRTEAVVPYALNGDTNGQFNTWIPRPGEYTLKAVPYVKPGATEFVGQPLEIHFTIYAAPVNTVQSFSIVNTAGNVIRSLNNGDVLNLNDPMLKQFGVIANTTGVVGSVKFKLDNNQNYRTENVAPYALSGDQNGYFNPWIPALGSHTLTATPYLGANATNDAGTPLKITFTVVKQNVTAPGLAVSLYPVPMKEDLFVNIQNVVHGNISVVLKDNTGHAVYHGLYTHRSPQPLSINTSGLSQGVYFLQLRGSNGYENVNRVVK